MHASFVILLILLGASTFPLEAGACGGGAGGDVIRVPALPILDTDSRKP